ncbi:Transmembrane protein [Ceratobasidium theobromae]|uniref:Transmembrane protein n=1 Tax=Ceratobasidium theobromae TaxID=1582974 RepID=A0A5N5QDL0_9AGAM|nr:Transmembrane protein [Ceratobasidium theobromae]
MSSTQNNQQSSQSNAASTSNSVATAGSSSSSSSTIPQTAPPGTLSFTIPAQTITASYYKIMANNPITFGWNFTSLISTPAALTVQAYCADNGNTYRVGPTNSFGTVDGIIPGTATQVVWDAYAQQSEPGANPLVQATYTLRIFDERGLTAGNDPGKLSPNTNVKFAMYSPAQYTPIESGWKCVSCSGATSSFSSPSFLALGMTLLVMMISGVGLLRGLVRNW